MKKKKYWPKNMLTFAVLILFIGTFFIPAITGITIEKESDTISLSMSKSGWIKTFGTTDWDDVAYSVQQTSDGGYILVGYTESYGAGDDDAWLIKTDANGNKQWDKTFGGAGWDMGESVQQTSDGGYIIAGKTNDYAWLIKTDANGNKQWDKTFGENGKYWGQSAQQTSDSGYIMVAFRYTGGDEVWLIKYDADGNEQWNKSFGGSYGTRDHYFSVEQTDDGGYIISGSKDTYRADVWLIKTDDEGNKQWDKTFGKEKTGYDCGNSVQQTSDGGYIVAGFTGDSSDERDVWLIKTDDEGNKQWDKTFGGAEWEGGQSVQQTSDGGYIIAGWKGYGPGRRDIWLIKTDDEGNKQWDKTLGAAGFRIHKGLHIGYSIQQTSDEGFIIAGKTSFDSATNANIILIKTDKNGNTCKAKSSNPKFFDSLNRYTFLNRFFQHFPVFNKLVNL